MTGHHFFFCPCISKGHRSVLFLISLTARVESFALQNYHMFLLQGVILHEPDINCRHYDSSWDELRHLNYLAVL